MFIAPDPGVSCLEIRILDVGEPVKNKDFSAFCQTCLALAAPKANRCASCGSRRIIGHPELFSLAIAHLDCDAFYAAVEKRDDPGLADKPVIIGGGKRGVVSTACYLARTFGVRSAMPMFQALQLCPDAVVLKPDMAKYVSVSRQIRALMESLTPLVEPLSIDEAFLDLTGTEKIHRMPPAIVLSGLQRRIEDEIGVTVSIGLSHNKFLAKVASDLDKPRGFSVIGRAEAISFLARQPVTLIWGVGAVTAKRLQDDGIRTIAQLQELEPAQLTKKYGELGLRLARIARGDDDRPVTPSRETKSVSAETTFDRDVSDLQCLEDHLWDLCERASASMKKKRLAGRVITLKLKSAEFQTITRRTSLPAPTALARVAFDAARPLLASAASARTWRLIGVGFSDLTPASGAPQADFFGTADARLAAREAAMDLVRAKYGESAIGAGRSLRNKRR